MKHAVVWTRYVGLVTGATLSEIGHHVTCIDIDKIKVEKLKKGTSPMYEPNLSELMEKNIGGGGFIFTTSYEEGFNDTQVIYIAVGTLKNNKGSANLQFVEQVATTIALTAKQDTIVVTKSDVPVGTNDRLKRITNPKKLYHITVEKVLNSISGYILSPTRYLLMESW